MTWTMARPSAAAAIPQPHPAALSYLLLIPVLPDLFWDGKIPNSVLLSAPFAAWDHHVLQFCPMGHEQVSTGEVLKQMPLSWPLFPLPALKVELKAGSAAFQEMFSSQAPFLSLSVRGLQSPRLLRTVAKFSPPVPPLCTFQALLPELCLIDDHSPICFPSLRKLLKSLIPDDFLMCSFYVCFYNISFSPLLSFKQGLGCTQALRLPT